MEIIVVSSLVQNPLRFEYTNGISKATGKPCYVVKHIAFSFSESNQQNYDCSCRQVIGSLSHTKPWYGLAMVKCPGVKPLSSLLQKVGGEGDGEDEPTAKDVF